MSYSSTTWQTVLDLDFTAQTTQTLSPDTTYTIGGLTFTKHNSANESSNTVLTNGTGIVFHPNTTGDCVNTTRTFPLLFLPFSQLNIPNLNWETAIRVWADITSTTPTANFDNSILGIGNDSTDWYYVAFRGFNSSTGLWTRRTINGSTGTSGVFGVTTNSTTSQVMSISIEALWGAMMHANLTTATVPPWPSFTRPMNSYHDATGQQTDGFAGNAGSPGAMGVFFGAMTPTHGGFVSTIARLRIDVRN